MTMEDVERPYAPVTVVVPVHDAAGTVGRAIASVLRQTVMPAEIILIDDCSTDSSANVIELEASRYPEARIRLLRQKQNLGPATARNAGWNAAVGRFIAFLDADDTWHPRKLEIQCRWMESHPDIVLTGHACTVASGEESAAPPADIPA